MRKTIIYALIAFIVVASAALLEKAVRVRQKPTPMAADQTNTLPGGIVLKKIGSSEKLNLDNLRGKVVLLNFWATWCSACVAELPSMMKLYEALHADGFEIIAINSNDQEDLEKVVPEFIKKLGLNFPTYFEDNDKRLERSLQVVAIPFSALLDKQGKILWSESGERDWMSETMIAEVKKHLQRP